MKTLISILTIAIFCLVSVTGLSAQEASPKKYDNPEWKRVVMVDFHSGKMGKAMNIINNYYKKAAKIAGTPTPSLSLILNTGDYDYMLVWDLQGGVEDLNWDISPNNIKWRKALEEVAGGKEKADALREEYSSCVRSTTSNLARVAD